MRLTDILTESIRSEGVLLYIPNNSQRAFLSEKASEVLDEHPEMNAIGKLHMTLLNGKTWKPFKKDYKKVNMGTIPFDLTFGEIKRAEKEDKISYYILVNEKDKIDNFLKEKFGVYEPERIYHFSLVNLDGNSHSSIGKVWEHTVGE